MRHLVLKEKAYEIIKEKLLTGSIKPGERIREDLLAEEISMSRTPVREAINKLSAEGFVNNIARKGVFAALFTKEELRDIVELRALLESYAVRRCCRRITDKEIKELEGIFNKFKHALLKHDDLNGGVYDGLFHKKIADFSHNKKAISYIHEIEDFAILARRMDIYSIKANYSEEQSIKQHEDILEAIKNRDEDAAAKAIEKNAMELLNRMGFEKQDNK